MPWLEILTSIFQANAPRELHLGAFGKHPGWDDHLEDFGLETEALVAARQLLYVRGIGGAIDSAVWDNLPPENVLPEFNHLLFWFSESDAIVGRMWSSSDRKGRKRYPMVVCVHLARSVEGLTIESILDALQEVEAQCKASTSAEAVLEILRQTRNRLRVSYQASANGVGVPPLGSRKMLSRSLELTVKPESWPRICYALETQLTAFTGEKLPDKLRRLSVRMTEATVVAQHVRLPSRPDTAFPTVEFWRDFIDELLAAKAPLLLLQPQDRNWVDVVVGTPGPQQLFCLRAAAEALPPTADIPYSLPSGFETRATQLLAAFCGGTAA